MKICANRQHYKSNDACRAPQNVGSPNLVDGERERRWLTCSSQREDGFVWSILLQSCGRRARWFVPANDNRAAAQGAAGQEAQP